MGEVRSHGEARAGSGFRSRRGLSLLLLLAAWWIALGAVGWERGRVAEWTRTRLEASLSSAVGGTVRITSLDLDLLRLRAHLSGVFVSVPAPGAPPLTASLNSAVVQLDWTGLAAFSAGRVHLRELILNAPRIALSQEFLQSRRRRRREPTPMDLRIGRLEVRHGTFHYDEAAAPLDFRARHVRAHGTWGVFRRAMIGDLHFTAGVDRAPLARPYPLEVHTGFRLRGDRLDLSDLRAKGPGIESTLDLHVAWERGVVVTGGGPVRAHLDRLAPWLEASFPAVGGEATWDLVVDRKQDLFRLLGKARATDACFGSLKARRAEADVLFQPGALTLEGLHAAAYGGALRGRVAVNLKGHTSFRTRMHGAGLDAAAIFRMLGRPLPLASRVRVDLDLQGSPGSVRSWEGAARFQAEPAAGGPRAIPTRATGTFRIEGGRLKIADALLETSGADLRLALQLDLADPQAGGEVRVEGTTRSARGTQAGVLALLEELRVNPGDLLRRPVDGAGGFRARIVLGAEPGVEADVDLRNGAWLGLSFLQARLHADLGEGAVRLREVSVRGKGYRVTGEMDLDLDRGDLLHLRGRAAGVDAHWFASVLQLPVNLTGRLTGDGSLDDAGAGLRGEVNVLLEHGSLAGETLSRATGSLEFAKGEISLREGRISGPAFDVRLEGGFDTETESSWFQLGACPSIPPGRACGAVCGVAAPRRCSGIAVVADALHLAPRRSQRNLVEYSDRLFVDATLHLGALEAVQALGVEAEGEFHIEGPFRINRDGPAGTLTVRGQPCRIAGREVGSPRGVLLLRKDDLEVDLETEAEEEDRGWLLKATVGWSPDLPLNAVLKVQDGEIILDERGVLPGRLRAGGRFRLQGPLSHLDRMELVGTVQRAKLHVGTRSLSASEPFPVRFDRGRLVVGPAELEGGGRRLQARFEQEPATGRLGGELQGDLDLGMANAFLPGIRCFGAAHFDLSFGGTTAAPELHGAVSVRGGRLRLTEIRQDVEQVQGDIRLLGGELEVVRLHGFTGGGEITINGGAALGSDGLDSYRADVTVENVRVAYPAGFRGVYRGNLLVRGDLEAAIVDGDVNVVHALYQRPFEFASLLGTGTREYAVQEKPLLPVELFLNIHLHSNGNVWVRNDLARLESRFDLRLGGKLSHPELTGRLWFFEGGRIEFRDVRYRVESGSLDFVQLDRINPYLDLRAETQVGGYDVHLHIEGTMDRFDYQLTSDPALPSQDIIALLMTGRTLVQGAPGTPRETGSTGFTGNLAASYFAGALTGRFEKTLRRSLGLERVWIDPLLVGEAADPTTRVTLGKELSDDVTLVYSTDLGTNERQIYRVEWQVSPRFRLTTERDTTGGVGGDLKFFGRLGKGGKRKSRRRKMEASAGAATVRAVAIEGLPEKEIGPLRKRLGVRPGQPYRRMDALAGVEAIRRSLVQGGRLEARISMEEDRAGANRGEIIVRYIVAPGPKVNVEIRGVREKEARQARDWLMTEWRDMLVTDDLYEDGRQTLLRRYHAEGYYAADVEVEPGPVSDGGRTVVYVLDPGSPVSVGSVLFSGVEAVPEIRIRRQMLTHPPGLFSTTRLNPAVLEEDLAAIRSLYRDEGYLAARVGPPVIRLSAKGDSADITIPVKEGPRYSLAGVVFKGKVPLNREILHRRLQLRKGEPFAPSRVAKAASTLRVVLDAAGYPDARVSSRIVRQGTAVTVAFQVDPGSRKTVGEIRIEGNTRTKTGIIRRELLLRRGDPISRDRLLRTQHALYRLGIFREVRLSYAPQPAGEPGAQTLVVHVEESPPLSVTVAAGYDTEAGARGGFTLTHANVGGRDRTLSFQGRASSLERRLQVVGEEPRLFGHDLHAFVSVGRSREERPAFTEKKRFLSFRVEKSFRPKWKGFFRYNFQRVDLFDVTDEQALLEEKLENLRLADAGYTIRRDTRDDPFRPTRGGYGSADLRVFGGPLPSDADFVKLLVQSSLVKQLQHGQDYAAALRFGLAATYGSTTRVPLTERFFAGGDSTLRGFPRDGAGPRDDLGRPIGGEALFLVNQEWRFPIWRSLRGVLFHDAGNVFLKPKDFDPGDLRNVLGAGLRLETPIGPVRLEYGRKVHRRAGESAGELYLSIGSAF